MNLKTIVLLATLCATATAQGKLSRADAETLREKLRSDYEEKLFKPGVVSTESAGQKLNFVKVQIEKKGTTMLRKEWVLAAIHPSFGQNSYQSGDLAPRTFEWIKANHQDLLRADVRRVCVGRDSVGLFFWACFKMHANIEEVKYKDMQP